MMEDAKTEVVDGTKFEANDGQAIDIQEDFTIEELIAIYQVIGQVPVAMDSQDFKRFANLRNKLARKIETKKAQPTS